VWKKAAQRDGDRVVAMRHQESADSNVSLTLESALFIGRLARLAGRHSFSA
jgi:hypothetical protein